MNHSIKDILTIIVPNILPFAYLYFLLNKSQNTVSSELNTEIMNVIKKPAFRNV